MQYGFFDDINKEYVITRPDTPRSWSNYLGSTEYGAIITNNAGGYSFYKSGGMGRFTRIRFNAIPMDQPGRYLYLRDKETGDYWSASWQPVGKSLEKYRSECRHGAAYTIIRSEYESIESETTYFVPLNQNFEVWLLRLTNHDNKQRKLSVFTFVEYANCWNALQDLLNLQYTQYIARMSVVDGIIDHGTNVHIPSMPDNFAENDQGRHTFLVFVGGDIVGHETDLSRFLGPYRTYANPIAVEKGECSNFMAAGDNVCGVTQIDVDLNPGESRYLLVLMGIGEAAKEGKEVVAKYGNTDVILKELSKLKEYWHSRIDAIQVQTPDSELNSMLNMWGPYNCQITFNWSRAASLVYTAMERDGLGYRDSVQDVLGVIANNPDEARQRLELMLTGQVSTGGAMPVVNKIKHQPGKEQAPNESEYRSDDCLWLFNAVPAYVKETGDISFYRKVLPYADKGEDTVLAHLRKAIEFNLERTGWYELPSGLFADWNDCLRFGRKGVSIFVAMQVRFALNEYIEICKLLGNITEQEWAQSKLDEVDEKLWKYGWDGEWFIRGYTSAGEKVGSKENKEGKIYLNPQAWAVISGIARDEKAILVMDKVYEWLFTEFGIALCNPPYTYNVDYQTIRSALFNPSMKENGAIFTHTQGWAVMAETILGRGNRAYEYFRAYLPAAYNTRAEVRQIEPYVYNQSTHGKYSPHYGESRLPWLSGSASWSYYVATHYILGIRPHYQGLQIDPCIPSVLKEFQVTRRFKGKILKIKVNNPNQIEKGVKQIMVNGKPIEGNIIPDHKLIEENLIEVLMG